MDILMFLLKILAVIGIVALMFSPIIAEILSFRKDRKTKISHKRFRILIFSIVYFILITVLMIVLADLLRKLNSLGIISLIVRTMSIPARFNYAAALVVAVLINLAIGLAFRILLRFVRIGLKKKELVKPKKKNNTYSLAQRIERRVLKAFNNEKWFFVGKTLKFLSITLTAGYALVFVLYLVPVLWSSNWIPYNFVFKLFESGYIYPMITLLPMWEAYFFLAGVEQLESECPELALSVENKLQKTVPDLDAINEGCKKLFASHLVCQIDGKPPVQEVSSTDHSKITMLIAEGVERDQRNPAEKKECYMRCLDAIVKNDISVDNNEDQKYSPGTLVNGSFFSEFSKYFFRYISVILSRGDNIIFVCNNNSQVEQTYSYIEQALVQMYSLYHTEKEKKDVSFDSPVWRMRKVCDGCSEIECSDINNCSVLVTDLDFLTSKRFGQRCKDFIYLVDTVVFVDAVESVNNFSRQMSVFEATVRNLREENAVKAKNSSDKTRQKAGERINDAFKVRYVSAQIKYVFFGDERIPGLDKVLNNLLCANFVTANAMRYGEQTTVVCYNYEGSQERLARTDENLSILANISDCAVAQGAGKVSLFAEQKIPFRDISESIEANANNGLVLREGTNITINKQHYDLGEYSVVVAFDDDDNLPLAIRSHMSRASDKPSLVMLFSRPYMFRDYYFDNAESLWQTEQIMRIPVEQSGKHNVIQRILVKANAGGISTEEIFNIITAAKLDDYKEAVENNNISEVLRRILIDCGKHPHEALNWNRYFEYISFRDFDNNGKFTMEERVRLRRSGALFELLEGSDTATIVIDGCENCLPIAKCKITHNHIVGQNILYDGEVYTINNIDTKSGKIYVKRATGGKNNIPYMYIQNREYHIDFSETNPERVYATKHVILDIEEEFKVNDVKISVTRRPMEVITKGYTPIDPYSLAKNGADSTGYFTIEGPEHIEEFKQTYRKYGDVKDPVCPPEMIMDGKDDINVMANGALVMSIKLTGEFGEEPARIATLAAAMIGELLHEMFPSAADSIAVCPVLNKKYDDKESNDVFEKLPEAFCRGYASNPGDIELLIIEDQDTDAGVISVLMSSGDSVMKLLFSPIRKYLEWYTKKEVKSKYLYYGNDQEPQCFDFAGLATLAEIIGKEKYQFNFVNTEAIARIDTCDFCGKRYHKGTDCATLADGRTICQECSGSLVGNDKKELKMHLDRARIFLESAYGITLEDYEFCYDSTVKIINTLKQNKDILRKGTDVPLRSYIDKKNRIHIEHSLPSACLSELFARELTRAWQLKNLPDLDESLAEGHIALVAIQYLSFLQQSSLVSLRTNYYESTNNISGAGYRKIVRGLLTNSHCENNPFLYLLNLSEKEIESDIIRNTKSVISSDDFGLPYTPESPDRALDGNVEYFYYSRLDPKHKAAYDRMVDAIKKHEENVTLGDDSIDLKTVSTSILYDHPELFWYKTCGGGGTVQLYYGVTARETAELQTKIDEAVAQYMDGIDDSMSAYDVALRLYIKLINSVDYDTIALAKQNKAGGTPLDEIDYLRNICGVFIHKSVVCEGYARALQYLLQKCGIECAEVVGNMPDRPGKEPSSHAWNIVKIDGDYYYLDSTWDDSSDTIQAVKTAGYKLNYFCITTDEIKRSRKIDLCPTDVPQCNAIRANYYYHNDCVIDSYDVKVIKMIAQNAVKANRKSFTFKCASESVYNDTFKRLCDNVKDCYDVLKSAAKLNKQIVTDNFEFTTNDTIRTITVKFRYK